MAVLLVNSIFMWTLIMERLFFFHGLLKRDISMEEGVSLLCNGKAPDGSRGIKSRLLKNLFESACTEHKIDIRRIELSTTVEKSGIKKNLSLIAVLAAISPLLGLLGTVAGMITTFDVISFFGTGNAKAMAGGISTALITTQSGLIIAIPGLIMSSFLNQRAKNMDNHLEEFLSVLKRHV